MTGLISLAAELPSEVRTILGRYRTALLHEARRLRNGNESWYRVSSGARLREVQDGYLYRLAIDASFPLAENTPIVVSEGDRTAEGIILSRGDFDAMAVLKQDLGKSLAPVFLRGRPWVHLDALGRRLELIDVRNNRIAVDLLLKGPKPDSALPCSDFCAGKESVRRRAHKDPITIVWTPPGTGGLHALAETAIEALREGLSVLVVSPRSSSADALGKTIAQLLRGGEQERLLWGGRVMRYGSVLDGSLAADEDVTVHAHAVNADPERREKMAELQAALDVLYINGRQDTPKPSEAQIWLQKLLLGLKEDEDRCLNHARLVVTTLSQLYTNSRFDERQYDVVLLADAAMANMPQVLCAAAYARRHLVLAGDFRQPSPLSWGEGAPDELSQDVFSFLGIVDRGQLVHPHPWLVVLREQSRMHRSIAEFINCEYYDRLLLSPSNTAGSRDGTCEQAPDGKDHMVLLSLRGTFCPSMVKGGHGRLNIMSAVVSFGIALTAAMDGKDVGIIATYADQLKLIRALVSDWQESAASMGSEGRRYAPITCSTIRHIAQSPRDVVVLDTVESFPAQSTGEQTSSSGKGSVDRTVNYVVSRAKDKLVVVANPGFWASSAVDRYNAYARLMAYQTTFGTAVTTSASDLTRFIHGLKLGPYVKAFTEIEAEREFLDDLKFVSRSVSICIPDGELDRGYDKVVREALRRAQNRGAQVRVVCFAPEELPDDWEGLARQSDDAVFPLAILDGAICWYGLPPSSFRVPTKDGLRRSSRTRLPLRIEGQATVATILRLSGIDNLD